jgi:hypothetical protein
MYECEHTVARRAAFDQRRIRGAGKRLRRVITPEAGGWERGRLVCSRKNRSMEAQLANP